MQILSFDIDRGVYHFNLSGLETGTHSHPATELIIAKHGSFTLETASGAKENLSSAIIAPNTPHSFHGTDADCHFLMFEWHDFAYIAHSAGFSSGQNISGSDKPVDLSKITAFANALSKPKRSADARINTCLDILDQQTAGTSKPLEYLSSRVHLSPGRLSHLFKQEVGISLRKYVNWALLRNTISYFLHSGSTLTDSSLNAGFYDSPHFTRHFKQYFGVRPSLPYNSQIVQVPGKAGA